MNKSINFMKITIRIKYKGRNRRGTQRRYKFLRIINYEFKSLILRGNGNSN